MSAVHLHHELARLAELHGSEALLEALRDACHVAGHFTADFRERSTEASDAWHEAGDLISRARERIADAELGPTDLEGALLVLDDTVAA